jgi:hypothetical protein
VKRHILFALVLTFCIGPLHGATLERLSFDEMVAKSTAIVRGKVVETWAAFSGPVIYTHYRIQVLEQFKGASRNSTEVVVPGGIVNQVRQEFPGAAHLDPGEEYVLLLWTGKSGSTTIIGVTQGLFSLAKDSRTDPLARREATRERMLDPRNGRPVKDETLVMRLSELRSRIAVSMNRGQSR